jgi:molybdate transport system substrate-binding protein
MARFLLLLAALLLPLSVSAAQPVRIAAAADLQIAMAELVDLFTQQHPQARLSVTYGSSGVFATQLRQGAPFELYFSANADYVHLLHQEGLTRDAGQDYAQGRLAFFSREPLTADSAETALRVWQQQARSTHKIAIANPRHAPYGVAAIGWLEQLGLDQELKYRLVLGENAAQSVQFVLAGAARSGIVAWPLLSTRKDLPGQAWLIPADQHPPLQQRMVLMNNASATAQAFYDFMSSPAAREQLLQYGFGAP